MTFDEQPDPGGGVPPLADTATLKDAPTTARGVRTRAALVAAARRVFERDGFLDSRIVDIAAEARCSTGTFYTYFQNKDEAFVAVLEAAQDEMLHPGMPHVAEDTDPVQIIEASNRAYLASFLRNAKLMAIMQQVASIDPKFREVRRRRAALFAERNARHIAELQQRGLADQALDPLLTSMALSGMVSRVAMDVLVGEGADLEDVVAVVTALWVNGLRLPREA